MSWECHRCRTVHSDTTPSCWCAPPTSTGTSTEIWTSPLYPNVQIKLEPSNKGTAVDFAEKYYREQEIAAGLRSKAMESKTLLDESMSLLDESRSLLRESRARLWGPEGGIIPRENRSLVGRIGEFLGMHDRRRGGWEEKE